MSATLTEYARVDEWMNVNNLNDPACGLLQTGITFTPLGAKIV